MFHIALPWNSGETRMHRLLNVPSHDNPTVSALSPQASNMLQRGPLIAVGTLDAAGNPWTTVWGGETGLSQPVGANIIGIKTPVERTHDPVVQALFGNAKDGEIVREQGQGRMVSALTLDLETRKRVKLYGRMVAGALGTMSGEEGQDEGSLAQLVVRIDQSLGNCPKYINQKRVWPITPAATLVSDSPVLCPAALALIARADLFFVSTADSTNDMDTNHRGGPPGFVRARVAERAEDPSEKVTTIVWPEYSGNRLYQSLGNMVLNPRAGLVFPDFETGDVLYVTGTTEILVGADAAAVLSRSNLVVRIVVTAARFVTQGLPFRGAPTGDNAAAAASPYNPKVRFLRAERGAAETINSESTNTATLISQTKLTSTISRFRFSINGPMTWKAGQWVALDMSRELDEGYSHMRNDDPRSLNDDFIRTFTVSSPPGVQAAERGGRTADEFEITIRRVGVVTAWLFKQNDKAGVEVGLKGFGGEFSIAEKGQGQARFVAAGVGITPLLAAADDLDLTRLQILWTVRAADLGLVKDTLERMPGLAGSLTLFITGIDAIEAAAQENAALQEIKQTGITCELRRLKGEDFEEHSEVNKWYICVGTALRKNLIEWLPGKEVLYEDFNF